MKKLIVFAVGVAMSLCSSVRADTNKQDQCVSVDGRVLDKGFLECAQAGGEYFSSIDSVALSSIKGKYVMGGNCNDKSADIILISDTGMSSIPQRKPERTVGARSTNGKYFIYQVAGTSQNIEYVLITFKRTAGTSLEFSDIIMYTAGRGVVNQIRSGMIPSFDGKTPPSPAPSLVKCD